MTAALAIRPPLCETRVGKLDDLAFVVDCWTKNDPQLRTMRLRDSTRHVRELLARAGARLLIAHVPGEPDSILGWAATEDGKPPCIHYIYVRSLARLQGVARAMVGSTDIRLEYSHVLPRGIVVPAMWTLNLDRAKR